jgi:hypothetical protein
MPRKVFTAGEVLTAADVQEYLSDQTVMTFAGTAARGSAIGTAVEGMLTYLADTDAYEYWDGADWEKLANPMTTAGDLIVAGTAGVAQRLGIGADAEVLTVIGGAPAWAAGGGGGALSWELLNPGGTAIALTGAGEITLSSIGGYDNYVVIVEGASGNGFTYLGLRANSIDSNYRHATLQFNKEPSFGASLITGHSGTLDRIYLTRNGNNSSSVMHGYIKISGASQEGYKAFESHVGTPDAGSSTYRSAVIGGMLENTALITSLTLSVNSGDFDAGTMYIYGA